MYLRQSTASQTRVIGPFVDDTDFKTLKTGAFTIANTDVKLSKNGAAQVNKNSGGGTFLGNGDFAVTWNATDTDTVGELEISVKIAAALVVKRRYLVVEEAIYDSLFAASAVGYVVPADLAIIDSGTAQGGLVTSITLRAAASFATNLISGSTVHIASGTGAGQSRIVHAWNNTTKVASVSPDFTTAPDNTSVYKLIATPPAGTSSPPEVNTVQVSGTIQTARDIGASVLLADSAITAAKITTDALTADKFAANALTSAKFAAGAFGAVWDETSASHLGVGTTGSALSAAGSAGDPWGTLLPGSYTTGTAGDIVGNRLNATVSSRAEPADIPSAFTIASAVWASLLEGSTTMLQAMRGFASVLMGKVTGMPTAPKFRDLGDTKTRIDATTTTSGDRTNVTRDLS